MQLDKGADVNGLNVVPLTDNRRDTHEEGFEGPWTPLHLAIRRGRYDIFQALKARGANIHQRDAFGYAPLHLAIVSPEGYGRGAVQIIKDLLDEGADINSRVFYRQDTALHMAARNRRVDFILCLLERGVDIEATNEFGETALQVAETSGEAEAAKALSEYRGLN